ncbi:cytochrome c [Vibrio sp. Sgm 22]|uniref:c-type cytochrome n=1 Tax=unclassified Vibrio TaxID=2614977 RepID=UPI002248C139|nr:MULTISPECIES: cytochrome c [unclassified Vibrio]MCX2757334.1 cytochrome c [Vibrio sp. 14G-20]MCX2774124.1 cytochrome c [Vibrio sp. Sgm 22]
MYNKSLALLIATLSFTLHAEDFGDPELGKLKSPSCVFCHNPTSPSTDNSYPKLSGQDPIYLFNAMKAYQNEERQGDYADMMRAQLSKLNDQDFRDVAAFYASQN